MLDYPFTISEIPFGIVAEVGKDGPLFITDIDALRAFVERARTSPVVGMDTEFMREKTYFAKLCLVQIATDSETALIDPLAIGDLTPLCPLLSDSSVVKVLHAGSQDLEILNRICGGVVAPVFDTQVAATIAGFQQQVGYGPLIHELLDVKLDKGDSYTDWARRPLTESQVIYARNDVRYLPEAYRRLMEKLESENRLSWLADEFSRMEDPATYEIVPEEQWRRVKRVSSLNRRQLGVAREIAAWREREAMRRDVPKRWVLQDEGIIEIARRGPATPEELRSIRGVSEKVGKGAVQGLLDAVRHGLECPEDDLPVLKKRKRPIKDVDAAVDLMIAIVRRRSRENGVAMPLIASRDDLERLANGERENHPVMEGWRKAMVGDELCMLLDGQLSLRLDDGELVVEGKDES